MIGTGSVARRTEATALRFWFHDPVVVKSTKNRSQKTKDMAKIARRFFINGDVQGVGYRFFAQRAAARHQVVGYVRNCPDGTVEAFAEGPATSVEAFKHDL